MTTPGTERTLADLPTPARFVFLCHTEASDTFRVGSHHLVRELARAGNAVVRVALPNSAVRRVVRSHELSLRRLRWMQVRRWLDADGVTQVELDLPSPLGRGPLALRCAMDALCARVVMRSLPWSDGIEATWVVDEPRFVGVCRRLGINNLIYRPTDLQDHPRTRAAERAMAPLSAAVIATSRFLLNSLPDDFSRLPSLVLPNGVDFAAFGTKNLDSIRPMRAIYVGSLDDRFDIDTVRAMALAHSKLAIDIYGPAHSAFGPVPPNVVFHGPADYSTVPALLHGARIGLLPLSASPLNNGRSPMKLYEYLAAGLNVVARRIPSLEQLDLPNVAFYSTAAEAVNALSSLLSAGTNEAGVNVAAKQDWSSRAQALFHFSQSHTVRGPQSGSQKFETTRDDG